MRSLVLALLFLCSSAIAEVRAPLPLEVCALAHLPYGSPTVQKSSTSTICREGYVVQHDDEAHIPIWVAYILTPDEAVGCFPRATTFKQDPYILPDSSASAKAYAKSGYDIGHMANNSDMRWSADTEEESNLFSNAAPQLPGLNRGAWKALEDLTRAYVLTRSHAILVYVGSIYDRKSSSRMKGSDVVIPDAFFKVLVDVQTNEVLAFVYEQKASRLKPKTFMTSFAEVQRRSGVLLPLPVEVEFSKTMWSTTVRSARAAKSEACTFPGGSK